MTAALRGVLWVLLGTFLFTILISSGKFAGDAVSAVQIVFFRYISGLVIISGLVVARRQAKADLARSRPAKHFLRSVLGASGVTCSLYATSLLPLVTASTIALTRGAFVVLLAIIVLGEQVVVLRLIAAAVSLLGALVAIGVFEQGLAVLAVDAVPATLGFIGAILVAGEVILIKTLSARDQPIAVIFWVHFFGSLLLAGPAMLQWKQVNWEIVLSLLALGPLGLFAQYCNIRGFQLADASMLAPVPYSRLIFSAFLGFITFGEIPATWTIWGGGLILLGGLILTFQQVQSVQEKN